MIVKPLNECYCKKICLTYCNTTLINNLLFNFTHHNKIFILIHFIINFSYYKEFHYILSLLINHFIKTKTIFHDPCFTKCNDSNC